MDVIVRQSITGFCGKGRTVGAMPKKQLIPEAKS